MSSLRFSGNACRCDAPTCDTAGVIMPIINIVAAVRSAKR
jgi:hypothetical protein